MGAATVHVCVQGGIPLRYSVAGGIGPQALLPCCSVPCGHGCVCTQKVSVMCICSPEAASLCGAAGSATKSGDPELQLRLPVFSWLCLHYVSAHTPLTYSCVKSSDIVVCWTEAPLLSCGCFPGGRLKGRGKQSISATMMLMSHQKDSSCSGGRQWHFRLGFRRR